MPKGNMAYTVKMRKRKNDTWRRVREAEGLGFTAQGPSLGSLFPRFLTVILLTWSQALTTPPVNRNP